MNREEGTAQVCERVGEVMKALPLPKDSSPAEVFTQQNLWSLEIRSTCGQVIEHYNAILTLVNQDFLRPAAGLSRNIHEACFRFEYLTLNKGQLTDWTEWQMSRDYHFCEDFLQYETAAKASTKAEFTKQKTELEVLMGAPPSRRGPSWKTTDEIIQAISSGMPIGHDKRLKRLLFQYPSNFVHIRAVGIPSRDYVIGGAQSSLLLVMTLAMKVCRNDQLLPVGLSGEIESIITLCDKLRE